MRIIAVIPARGGSKELPRKNIRMLNGKPLIAYSIEAAKESKMVDEVYVSTEDEEIEEIAIGLGAKVIVRPESLAGDDSSTLDVLKHAIEVIDCDYVVLLFPTHPLRNADDIDKLIELIIKKRAPSVCTITQVTEHPYWMTRLKVDGKANFFEGDKPIITERQKLSKHYIFGNTAVISIKHLRENNDYFLSRTDNYGLEIPKERCIDIHTEKDLLLIGEVIKNGSNE